MSDSSETNVTYAECIKNHAVLAGNYIWDGCGEFMASGIQGTHAALICAACGCHRSFHKKRKVRKEAVEDSFSGVNNTNNA